MFIALLLAPFVTLLVILGLIMRFRRTGSGALDDLDSALTRRRGILGLSENDARSMTDDQFRRP